MSIVPVEMDSDSDHWLRVPRLARLPIELAPPDGFDESDISTWPRSSGRFEYVDGRLLYMPPCGAEQQLIVMHLAHLLGRWRELHPGFDVGGNEAGMRLGRDTRAVDVGVWRRPDPPRQRTRNFRTDAPLLAIEVAGRDDADDESALLRKSKWYLKHGVPTVWLVLPQSCEVVVVTASQNRRFGRADLLPEPESLSGLSLRCDEIFSVL